MTALATARNLILLMAIGIVDLISTAVLHHQGLIVELNPIMRPIIDRSEWAFVAVKGATLVLAFSVMVRYARHNAPFVNRAALVGSAAYLALWCGWFIRGN